MSDWNKLCEDDAPRLRSPSQKPGSPRLDHRLLYIPEATLKNGGLTTSNRALVP